MKFAIFILVSIFSILASAQDTPLRVVEVMPRFPSTCEQDDQLSARQKKQCADKEMLEYVYNNLIYPAEARSQGIAGTVVIAFTLDTGGRMTDLEIKRSVHQLLDEAAMDVIVKMQEEFTWIPGQQRGEPVAVRFNLPIRFVDR